MTRDELLSILHDYFREWIDGDDPVDDVITTDDGVRVHFESSAVFVIGAEDIT